MLRCSYLQARRQGNQSDVTGKRNCSSWPSAHTRQYAVSTESLSDKIFATTQEWQVPKARQSESMLHVEVGWTTFLSQVLWKRLVSFSPGTFVRERIDTLGPTINRVKRKSATEA